MAIVVTSFLFLSSCGGGGSSDTPPPPPPVNEAPVFSSAASVQLFENGSLAYEAIASDPDSANPVTYTLEGGPDASLFEINSAAGATLFLSPPDFEAPSDSNSDNVYVVEIGATDNEGATTVITVEIQVDDASNLQVSATFPTDGANLGGEVTTTALTGVLTDTEDGEVLPDDIAIMTANGVGVGIDAANPASWTVDIPVAEGSNSLRVVVVSRSGSQDTVNLTVDNSLQFLYPIEVAVDAAGQRIIVSDGPRLLVGDLVNRALGHGARSYPLSLGASRCKPMAYDSVNGRALYLPNDLQIQQSGLTGGWSPMMTDINNPRTPGTSDLCNMQVDATGTRAFVLETIPNPVSELRSLDLATGDLTVISGDAVGSGESVFSLRGLTVDEANGVAFAADHGFGGKLLSIDLVTGNRTVVSPIDLQFPMKPDQFDAIDNQHYLVFDAQRQLFAYSNYELGYVMGIDAQTGARSELSSASRGAGPLFSQPLGMSFDDSSGRLFVTDPAENTVFEVDMDTGDRTAIFDTGLGDGPSLSFPGEIRRDEANNRLLVVSQKGLANARGVLYSVDVATGNRTLISGDGVGAGPALNRIFGFDTNLRRSRVLALVAGEALLPAVLMEIDLTTGARNIVSGEGVGAGPAFSRLPLSIAVDPTNQRAFVADFLADTLYEVDLASGDRVVLADGVTGSGAAFARPEDVVYDPSGNRLFIGAISNGKGAILAIDLSSGFRSVISEDSPTAPAPGGLYSLQVNFDGSRLIGFGLTNRGAITKTAIVAVDTGTGEREQLSFFAPDTQETPNFMPANGVAWDESRNRAFVTTAAGRIRVVDLKSGRSAVISD
jgi:DNA-binding beta-propeller fold protein YncE